MLRTLEPLESSKAPYNSANSLPLGSKTVFSMTYQSSQLSTSIVLQNIMALHLQGRGEESGEYIHAVRPGRPRDHSWSNVFESLDDKAPFNLDLPFLSKPCVSPSMKSEVQESSVERRRDPHQAYIDQIAGFDMTWRNTFGYSKHSNEDQATYQKSFPSPPSLGPIRETSLSEANAPCEEPVATDCSWYRPESQLSPASTSWYSSESPRMAEATLVYPHCGFERQPAHSEHRPERQTTQPEQNTACDLPQGLDEYHYALLETTESPSLTVHFRPTFHRRFSLPDGSVKEAPEEKKRPSKVDAKFFE